MTLLSLNFFRWLTDIIAMPKSIVQFHYVPASKRLFLRLYSFRPYSFALYSCAYIRSFIAKD